MFTAKCVAAFAVMASAGLCADVLLTDETEYNVVKGASQNITEKISGTGSIKKTGEGTLVLKNGQNDFSGGVTIESGVVNGETAKSFGTGSINVGAKGAAVHFGVKGASGTIEYSNPINVSGATAEGFAGAGNTDGVVSMFFLSDSCLKGDITASRNFRIRVNTTSDSPLKNNGASATFDGVLNAQGKNVYVDAYNKMVFNGPIKAGKVYFGDQWSAGGEVTLASIDNEITYINLGNERIVCAAENVLGNGDFSWYPTGGFQNKRGTIDMRGFNQKVKSIGFYRNSNVQWWAARLDSGEMQCFMSESPAVLRVVGNASSTPVAAYATLRGKVSLMVDSKDNLDFVQKFMHADSPTTGDLIVSNGTLRLEGSCVFSQSPKIVVGPNGKFIVATTNTVSTLPSVKALVVDGLFDASEESVVQFPILDALEIGANAVLKFPEGTVISAKNVIVDGENVSLGEYNSSKMPQLQGAVLYHIGENSVALSWTGNASDEKVSNSQNWNDLVDLENTALSPTFALKGNKAIFDIDVSWKNLTLCAPANESSFSFLRDDEEHKILFAGDIMTTESSDKHNYVFDVPMMILGDSEILAHNKQTIEFKNAFSNGFVKGNINVSGKAYVSFTGTNVLDGKISIATNTCVVNGLLGTPNHIYQGQVADSSVYGISIKHKNNQVKAMELAGLLLDNATIENSMYIKNLIGVPSLETKVNTTNEIKGHVTFGNETGRTFGSWQPIKTAAGSELVFSGGASFSHSFRPYGNGVVRFRNKPISALQYAGMNPMGGTVVIETTGNTFTNVCLGYQHSIGASNVLLEMAVSGAMTNGCLLVGINAADTGKPSSSGLFHKFTLQINTTTQKCEKLAVSDRGIVKGSYPAMIEISKGKMPEDSNGFAVAGKVEGGVGFRMSGDDDAVLKFEREAFTSCGDLEVVSGTMEFANDASWLNGTNITVSGTGVLKLNHGEVFNPHTSELFITENGKVNIPTGAVQTFLHVYVNETKLSPGVYNQETLPQYVIGGGSIAVYNPGTILVIR